jgi:hypothetical protein
VRSHLKDGEGWNEVQDFWDSVAGVVTRDGWTHPDTYDDAVAVFSELRETGLKVTMGKDKEIFEEQTRWADTSTKYAEME